MTNVENERLAIVENEIKTMKGVVDQFSGKLDTIHTYVLDRQVRDQVAREGAAYRKWLAPIIVTVVNGIVAAISLGARLIHIG